MLAAVLAPVRSLAGLFLLAGITGSACFGEAAAAAPAADDDVEVTGSTEAAVERSAVLEAEMPG